MSDSLTALDGTFLELEEADESAHMHIGSVMTFAPGPRRRAPSLAALQTMLTERLPALPRYSQRLSTPHTGGLRWPVWELDPDFSIGAHVHEAALPGRAGQAELLSWAGDYWSVRLDRRRPLWDAVLIRKLEGGRWALATKTHHALVDGVGSVDVAYAMLDDSPLPRRHRAAPPPAPEGGQGTPRGLLRSMPGTVVKGAQLGLDAALHPAKVKEALERSAAMVELIVRDGHGLRAMVPVSVRSAAGQLELGNKVTSLFVQLPVAEPDALRRYEMVTTSAESLKSGNQAIGGSTLVELTSLAPPALHAFAARALFASRLFNLTITNVPGPRQPLYAFGARMEEVYPLVPLAAAHAVGIAVVSYGGRVFFGLHGDERAAADLGVLRDGIAESLAELVALSRPRRRSSMPAAGVEAG